MDRLAGKVALVTGAASGIGRATALASAREGAAVVVSDIDKNGKRVAEEIKSAGARSLFLVHDVADESAWQTVVARTVNEFSRLDILVNNAGIASSKPIAEMTLTEWRRVMAVNLDGVFLGTKHAVTAMRQQGGGGAIVNVSSVAGMVGIPGASAYSASKGAVRMFSKAIALECAKDGIRVNSIHPGGVKTSIWEKSNWWADFIAKAGSEEKAWKILNASTPLKRMAEPEEIAEAILYLASDAAGFVTGSELVIDGGYSAQ